MNGLLVIDKPQGMTSRDAVNRVQRWFPRKTKIGHTGTLDPLATGVLVVCVGAATRLADYVQAMGKSYASRFRLGAVSATDDADGEVTETPAAVLPSREMIESTLGDFIGIVNQVPPTVSALKIGGRRAHALVRAGVDVVLETRPVRIDSIRVTAYDWPFLEVEVDCGKGTYIRSIARDLGTKLGCGGLVQTLRRTRIGPFTADQGVTLDANPGHPELLPLAAAVAGLPQVRLDSDRERRFRGGQVVLVVAKMEGQAAVLSESGHLIGIGDVVGNSVRPMTVLNA